MSRLLKKSIKSSGIIKVNKMVKKIADKSDRVLSYKFFVEINANSTIIPEYPSLAQT